jgi:hypothetical protein
MTGSTFSGLFSISSSTSSSLELSATTIFLFNVPGLLLI